MILRVSVESGLAPEGEVLHRPVGLGVAGHIGVVAVLVAVAAGVAATAALVLWLVSVLLPLALAAGVVAYVAFRWRR